MHNEKKLLPLSLKRLKPLVDELIVVEGGPDGESDDGSQETVRSFLPEAKIITTSSQTAWSREEVAAALASASASHVMTISADMLLYKPNALRAAIESQDAQVYMCRMIDLWVDRNHAKKNGTGDMAGSYMPFVSSRNMLEERTAVSELAGKEKLYVPETCVYHLGWLRPFGQQIRKHIRHIETGAWEQTGAKLKALGPQAVESWAIHHVMRYKHDAKLRVFLPEEIADEVGDMSYMDGFQEYVLEYENRYEEEFYSGLMSSVPPELII